MSSCTSRTEQNQTTAVEGAKSEQGNRWASRIKGGGRPTVEGPSSKPPPALPSSSSSSSSPAPSPAWLSAACRVRRPTGAHAQKRKTVALLRRCSFPPEPEDGQHTSPQDCCRLLSRPMRKGGSRGMRLGRNRGTRGGPGSADKRAAQRATRRVGGPWGPISTSPAAPATAPRHSLRGCT
jgi:hypothetical protein